MKLIYNIIIIVCICALNLGNVHASEQHTKAVALSSILTTDSLQTQETKQNIVEALVEKQQAFEVRLYILTSFTLFLVLLFGIGCFLNRRGDKRLGKIVTLLEKSKAVANDKKTKNEHQSLDIDEAVVTSILYQLQQFEKEKGFLISKISLHEFAKRLQTNTKYLSKVINTYKLKSFRNYINDLRIQYSIQELENNSNYKKYTVKAMAKEAGFATVASFSKAFQKRTGETVSSFLGYNNQVIHK